MNVSWGYIFAATNMGYINITRAYQNETVKVLNLNKVIQSYETPIVLNYTPVWYKTIILSKRVTKVCGISCGCLMEYINIT